MIVKKSDDAVSPVIGVMLILVVTIVIAAVVAAVSTGMVTDTKTAPNVALDVVIDRSVVVFPPYEGSGDGGLFGPDLIITHISGDPIPTSDLELHFSWTHEGVGGKCSHSSMYSVENSGEVYGGGATGTHPMYMKATSPYSSWASSVYFGHENAILTQGKQFFTHSDYLCSDYSSPHATVNFGSPFMDFVFDNGYPTASTALSGESSEYYHYPAEIYNYYKPYDDTGYPIVVGNTGGIMDHLPEGTPVEVTIIHIPSNKPIYNKVVYVKESYKFTEVE